MFEKSCSIFIVDSLTIYKVTYETYSTNLFRIKTIRNGTIDLSYLPVYWCYETFMLRSIYPSELHTVCPRNLDLIHIVTYYIKLVKTSLTEVLERPYKFIIPASLVMLCMDLMSRFCCFLSRYFSTASTRPTSSFLCMVN